MTRRLDVQGLRAIAIGLVILAHAGVPWVGGGFIGVDVFFVVSGFLITSLLMDEAAASGRVRLGAFYARRARRILPAATVVLVATTLYSAAALSAARAERVADDTLWSAFFAANVHFAAIGTDYFAEGQATSPLQHFWSLAVEEQFYLVWPGVLAIVVLMWRPRARTVLLGVVAAICVSSFVWSVLLENRSVTSAYFSSPARGWELGIGALLALLSERLTIGRRTAELLAGFGLVAIVVPASVLGRVSTYSSWQLVVPVLGTAAVLAAGASGRDVRAARVLTTRPMQWVGDASYSLYLWHWPVLILGAVWVGAAVSPWESTGLVAIAAILGCLSYYVVERPFRRPGTWWRGSRRGLLLWPVAVGAAIGSTIWSAHLVSVAEQEQRQRSLDYYQGHQDQEMPQPGSPSDAPTVADRIARSLALADANAPIPFPLKNLEGLGDDLWNRVFDCYAGYDETSVPMCPLGDVDADRTVVAVGDSHVAMWLPALEVLGARQGFKVVAFVKFSCPPYDVPMAIKEVGGDYTECEEFRTWTLRQLDQLEPVAILTGARGLAAGLAASTPLEQRIPEWEAGVRSAVAELKTHAPVVKLLADVSEQAQDPAECLTTRTATMASCVTTEGTRLKLGNAMLRRAAASTRTDYVDVTTLVCGDGRCPLVVDRTATYADNDHVSVTWAKTVAGELGELLDLPSDSARAQPNIPTS
jgi:peptidoglycan/LPS O-acetylase OafA/YrhL